MNSLYNDTTTPMLKQYLGIKAQNPDTILFFRLGDFYEMFFDDAVLASSILGITLTARNKKDPNPVPLCGVPYHSAEGYIAKLLAAGKKVAICDQVEDPKLAKGIVKREVTRVLTPGVVSCGLGLSGDSNNFVSSIIVDGEQFGFAIADSSTGYFSAGSFNSLQSILSELSRSQPAEVIVPATSDEKLERAIFGSLPSVAITKKSAETFSGDQIAEVSGYEKIRTYAAGSKAAGALYKYICDTQMGKPSQIVSIVPFSSADRMLLDEATIRNLELIKTSRDAEREGSLLWALDRTKTSIGARKLRSWILYPLTRCEEISSRLNAVEYFVSEPRILRDLRESLSKVYDIERLTARIATLTANARDLVALKDSLVAANDVKKLMSSCDGFLGLCAGSLDSAEELCSEIERTIIDEPPFTIRDGGMIKSGVDRELDDLKDIISNGKDYIAKIEQKEKERTGISTLKVRFNRVFGYYIEITNAHLSKAPQDFIRKQTLTNAERFITPELKEYEEKVLGAEDKVKALEYEIFTSLRTKAGLLTAKLQQTADALAAIDVIAAFAQIASEFAYVKPEISDSKVIEIKGGRHPIVERQNPTERFVPNDVHLDDEGSRILLITGPNMAGKSTVMRQTAVIVLMAQIGSFVPAESAKIGIADRIFTRVGASDALSKGQSTFMVEMSETAVILKDATDRSLIIIDEIGRGTSTFDGLAIAWAVAEHLHDTVQARTMFATHYHELTEIALTKSGVKNMQIAVKEWNGEVVFLRKLILGATSRSYGIQVARLAGLPSDVISRSHEVLENLETGELNEAGAPRIAVHKETKKSDATQYHLFTPVTSEVAKRLNELDTSVITPIEAINILHELKQKV